MVGAAGRGLVGTKEYIKKMATDGGGGVVGEASATIATAKIGPGFESPKPG
jgi:hypothetical protein